MQIAEVVGFELTDPRLESVVVTDVTVSDDLRDAKVFCFIQGSEDDELCSLAGHCVPRSAEVRFCKRTCESDGDCRRGARCVFGLSQCGGCGVAAAD